jgi:hypothetical protein
MGDLRDHVIQALDVLDVDGGIDIDAVGQQFLDIEIALGMPAAGSVGVGELIDEGELWLARDDRVEIHLLEDLVPVLDALARDDFEAPEQRVGFRARMRLDKADYDIDACLEPCMGALQHLIGLADTGRGADEDLQPAMRAVLPPGGLQQGFRRGTLFGITALICHAANIVGAGGRA